MVVQKIVKMSNFSTGTRSTALQRLLNMPKSLRYGSLALLVWLASCVPGLALELRVAIQEGVSQVRVGTSNTGIIRDVSGRPVSRLTGGRSLTIAAHGSQQVKAENWLANSFWVEPENNGYVFIGNHWYRGRVLVTPSSNGVTAINYVDMEDYLYSVVGGEMPASWPLEALKAQAIAARSYVLYHRQRNRNPNYDIGNTTAWQVYDGVEDEAANTHAAVEATRDQVLTYNGQIIEAVFHSSSGGHTENVEDVWSKPLPYLRGVQDYDAGAPVYQWTQAFSLDDFEHRIPGVGRLQEAVPRQITPRGRVREIVLQGDRGSRVMRGTDFRRALGLRSTLFAITVAGDTVNITGRGFGHGIGMSQWGAHNMALQGYSYEQILGHYYQGAQLSQIRLP